MWGQVSMEKALRAFLSKKEVKAVDLSADIVRPLTEVMEALSDGVVFFAEASGTENLEFSEAVDDMVETDKLKKENAEMRTDLEKLTREYGDLSMKYAELEAAYKIAQRPVRNIEQVEDDYDPHDPTASAAISGTGDGLQKAKPVEAPPKKKRGRPAKSLSREEFLDAMARKRGEL